MSTEPCAGPVPAGLGGWLASRMLDMAGDNPGVLAPPA